MKYPVVLLATMLLASCSTVKNNNVYRTKEVSLSSTDLKIPETKATKVDLADEESEEEVHDEIQAEIAREEILEEENPDEDQKTVSDAAPAMESLMPKFVIDGVALPTHPNKQVYYLEGAEELNLENNFFDIPVVYNDQVKKWIHYFTHRGRKYFTLYVGRAGRYAPMIGNILQENNLPRDLIFLAMAESGFNNHAKSIAAAVGPWQFMPATGRSYSLNQNWYVDERRDPVKATVAAAQYLGKLYNDFGAWEIATAAYNAGEGKLGRAIKKYNTNDFWKLTKGKYLKSETKNYVPKIIALAIIGKNLKTFGFDDIDFRAPLAYDEIEVGPMTDLVKLSEALKLDAQEVQRLNPEILRWFTPPDRQSYKLRLPPLSAASYADCCSKKNFVATDFQEFVVPKKMNLLQVSKKFRMKNSLVLSHLNSMSPKASLKKGVVIKLPFRKGEKLVATNRYYADLFEKPARKKRVAHVFHKVKRGESLHMIARKHKTSVKKLLAMNSSIPKSGKVYPGKRVVIR